MCSITISRTVSSRRRYIIRQFWLRSCSSKYRAIDAVNTRTSCVHNGILYNFGNIYYALRRRHEVEEGEERRRKKWEKMNGKCFYGIVICLLAAWLMRGGYPMWNYYRFIMCDCLRCQFTHFQQTLEWISDEFLLTKHQQRGTRMWSSHGAENGREFGFMKNMFHSKST